MAGRQPKDQILSDLHSHGINLNQREIYLHSYYVKDDECEPGVEYRQATTFIKNLHMLDTGVDPKPILIHIHSEGGCWYNGMAMYNAVQLARPYITMLAYSQASSMSGILLQAPTVRIMMPDCHFLMHQGTSDVGGMFNHPMAVKSAADFEQKACKRMLQIFAERGINGAYFKKRKSSTVESAYRFFDKKLRDKIDWFLEAEEAVFYGLADGILGSKEYPDVESLRGE